VHTCQLLHLHFWLIVVFVFVLHVCLCLILSYCCVGMSGCQQNITDTYGDVMMLACASPSAVLPASPILQDKVFDWLLRAFIASHIWPTVTEMRLQFALHRIRSAPIRVAVSNETVMPAFSQAANSSWRCRATTDGLWFDWFLLVQWMASMAAALVCWWFLPRWPSS
jgi:hypothetical protein